MPRRLQTPLDQMTRSSAGKRSYTKTDRKRGRYIQARQIQGKPKDVAFDATFRAAAPFQLGRDRTERALAVERQDIQDKVRVRRAANLILFVVDASWSMAAAERMEATAARSKNRDLYDHAIGTAALAQMIGEQSGISPEESFVAGLLHDIGKLAMLTLAERPQDFGGPPAHLGEAEIMMPAHHATVGAKILAEWGIPEELREPVLYHHRPYSTKRFAHVTRVVYAANRLSHRYGFGCRPDKHAEVLGDPQIYSLRLGEHWLKMLDARAPQVLISARRLMG